MQDPAWKPDYGSGEFPVDRGATMVTARLPLVNLKLYLTTNNEEAAKWVAGAISGSSKGLPDVWMYPGIDHASNLAFINVTVRNYSATPLYRVLEAIKTELTRFGTRIRFVETVGLVPQSALVDSALHYMQISNFSEDDVLETKMEHLYNIGK
jgi:glutamate formiminotransferase